MRRTAAYVILGAGIAGMTLQHQLRASSVVLLDGAPGRYKIGESIIPQHFAEPEIRPLFEIASRLPSASPKDGIALHRRPEHRRLRGLLYGIPTLHVARADLEAATAEFFGTEIVRERVESLDLDARTVVTDGGTWVANRLVIDCSGPARLVARALGLAREVWPVWASWAYHDVIGIDEDALFEVVRAGQKKFFRYSEHLRRADPDADWSGIRPSRCTTLTQVEDGVWTWADPPLRRDAAERGSHVSRHGPVDEEAYRALVGRSMAAQYRTRLREWDRSSPVQRLPRAQPLRLGGRPLRRGRLGARRRRRLLRRPRVYSVGTGFMATSTTPSSSGATFATTAGPRRPPRRTTASPRSSTVAPGARTTRGTSARSSRTARRPARSRTTSLRGRAPSRCGRSTPTARCGSCRIRRTRGTAWIPGAARTSPIASQGSSRPTGRSRGGRWHRRRRSAAGSSSTGGVPTPRRCS